MSDKELDNLVKDKFEDAEFAPSEALWGKIESQLEKPKAKKYPIFWMAAASITLTVGSFLIFQKTDKMQLQVETAKVKPVTEQMQVSPEPAAVNTPSSEAKAISEVNPTSTYEGSNATYASRSAKVIAAKQVETMMQENTIANNYVADKQEDVKYEKNISSTLQPTETISRLDNRNPETMGIAATAVEVGLDEQRANAIKTEFAYQNTEDDLERKGIRNVADLVNFVVDKVDKRDQKLLKFSPDDDNNMRLVGINIGLLKWNKRSK